MILKNKDFVWIYNGSEDSIEWGIVIDDVIIMQMGGFYSLDDFDNCLVAKPISNSTDVCYIGGIVRCANSFTSAKVYYYHWLTENDRFVNHYTNICVISNGEDFVKDSDKELYLNKIESPLSITVNELETIFDREVHIVG